MRRNVTMGPKVSVPLPVLKTGSINQLFKLKDKHYVMILKKVGDRTQL